MLFRETTLDKKFHYEMPLELAVAVVKQFRPSQLSDPPRSLTGNTLPLEDQYGKEFYRCLFNMLNGHVIISPEFVIKSGSKGGTIDFLVSDKKWGLELLRDRDRLIGHMNRFKDGGQYYSMIVSGVMEKHIVLDFTVVRPKKCHPGNTPLVLPQL
jgi:hypothetical protein